MTHSHREHHHVHPKPHEVGHVHKVQHTERHINEFRSGKPDSSNNWPDPINNLPEEGDAPPIERDFATEDSDEKVKEMMGIDLHQAMELQKKAAEAHQAQMAALQQAVPEDNLTSMAAGEMLTEDHLHPPEPIKARRRGPRKHEHRAPEPSSAPDSSAEQVTVPTPRPEPVVSAGHRGSSCIVA